jgi:hypothetical protein
MLEGYKILRAIDRRGDRPFLVAELATETGVSEATVRTVLSRESELLEERGRVETGRRGAKPKQLALRAEARGRLRDRLAALDALSAPIDSEDERESRVPEALAEAQEALLSPGARDGDRLRREATIGWLGFDAGRRAVAEAEGELRAELKQRLGILEAMLGLVELEQRAAAGETLSSEHMEACRELFEGLLAGDLDAETQAALDARLEQSAIGQAVARPLVQLMLAGTPGEELAAEVVSLLEERDLSVHQVSSSSVSRRGRFDFAVVFVGDEVEIDLEALSGEPVIVFEAGAERPELMEYADAHSALYVNGVTELANAIGFARRAGGSRLSAGERLLSH